MSYLDPSHSELSQGSAHLGGCRLQVLPTGDDFDKQGVIVGGNDGTLEGRGAVQTNSHTFPSSEDLGGATQRRKVRAFNRAAIHLGSHCSQIIKNEITGNIKKEKHSK